jgi:hypothetical protein
MLYCHLLLLFLLGMMVHKTLDWMWSKFSLSLSLSLWVFVGWGADVAHSHADTGYRNHAS